MMKSSKDFFMMKIPREIQILFYSVLSFFICCIFLICFFEVDEVIKTRGYIRTKENVSTLINVLPGKITDIYYRPGMHVKKGDLLYKIDPSVYESQKNNYLLIKAELERNLYGNFQLIQSYKNNENLINPSNTLYYSRFESYIASKNELIIKKDLSELLLNDEKTSPKAMRSDRSVNLKKVDYELAKNNLESFCNSFIAQLYQEKSSLEVQINNVNNELNKLENQFNYLEVCSPVDGYVQELSSLNRFDYLEADSKVLNIIPDDSKSFRVELQVLSKDIGKIKEGMKIKYRLSAFPFFEYKGAEGVITSIDPDIRFAGNHTYYLVFADIDKTVFTNKRGDSFSLKAGIETDGRIVLDKNPVIFYLLKKIDFIN